jgi:hypothetical protein
LPAVATTILHQRVRALLRLCILHAVAGPPPVASPRRCPASPAGRKVSTAPAFSTSALLFPKVSAPAPPSSLSPMAPSHQICHHPASVS